MLLDGALVSHLRQGFTTQLSGNCGYTFAPMAGAVRAMLDADLAHLGLDPAWTTFGDYLDEVERQPMGPNVALLVGHGTVRWAAMGPDGRAPTPDELAAMGRYVEEALDAGAVGVSSGLIYAPGVHAAPDEVAALVAVAARRGGAVRHPHAQRVGGRPRLAGRGDLDDPGRRRPGRTSRPPPGLAPQGGRARRLGHGGRAGRADRAARRDGLDAAADQYPYTAAATTLSTILPPSILALSIADAEAAIRDEDSRATIRDLMLDGVSGWENVSLDPGWAGIVISRSGSRPEWDGRSVQAIADELGGDPADHALDVLADDRLSTDIVIHCMSEPDVETIMRVPWIAVCTDAEGRRPDHPILGQGVPHPRTYGSTARVLGHYARDRGIVDLETAVAKLSAVPAARVGLRDRGVLREGAFADVVVFDPATVADLATYDRPAVHPAGIRDVIVNGRPAVRDGRETGERPGRLLRRGD